MTEADHSISLKPPVPSVTRRHAAALVTAGMAAGLTATDAAANTDPIFFLIEAHKRAFAECAAAHQAATDEENAEGPWEEARICLGATEPMTINIDGKRHVFRPEPIIAKSHKEIDSHCDDLVRQNPQDLIEIQRQRRDFHAQLEAEEERLGVGPFTKVTPVQEAACLASDRECDAISAVFRTEATTLAGALAQIRHVAQYLRDEILDEEDVNSDIHVPALLDAIASAIEKTRGAS